MAELLKELLALSDFKTIEVSNPNFTPEGFKFITVKSKNLKGRGDIVCYQTKGAEAYNNPDLVILLHGIYGSSWSWAFCSGVHQIIEDLVSKNKINPCIIVMPSDGLWGDGSLYAKHSGYDFEKWIIEDTILAVEEAFNHNFKNKYISGLSMGGFGALKLGFKYKEVFKKFYAHSSVIDLVDLSELVDEKACLELSLKDRSLNQVVNDFQRDDYQFGFDCGVDDGFYQANVSFSEFLNAKNIKHKFDSLRGEHNWDYWRENIKRSFYFFNC